MQRTAKSTSSAEPIYFFAHYEATQVASMSVHMPIDMTIPTQMSIYTHVYMSTQVHGSNTHHKRVLCLHGHGSNNDISTGNMLG